MTFSLPRTLIIIRNTPTVYMRSPLSLLVHQFIPYELIPYQAWGYQHQQNSGSGGESCRQNHIHPFDKRGGGNTPKTLLDNALHMQYTKALDGCLHVSTKIPHHLIPSHQSPSNTKNMATKSTRNVYHAPIRLLL